MEADLRK